MGVVIPFDRIREKYGAAKAKEDDMSRKNQTIIIAEQTRARIMMGFDAAIIAAHEALQLGPGRAALFATAYNTAMDELATLFVADCDENGDKTLEYAKAKRDELILSIVGEENFVPFERAYGSAYMDELRRIRLMQAASK